MLSVFIWSKINVSHRYSSHEVVQFQCAEGEGRAGRSRLGVMHKKGKWFLSPVLRTGWYKKQKLLIHYYVGRAFLKRTGCERVFISPGHGWLFHNPAQQKTALGAACLTFTNTASALPVLRRIKDTLAVKWNEAFEQAPNMCKTSRHVASRTRLKPHTHNHTHAHTQTSLG